MRRKRTLLLFAAGAMVLGALFVRVGYRSLGWGGYIYVDIVKAWKR